MPEIMSSHAGEWIAIGAAMSWVVSAIAFEAAGERMGSTSLNLIRLVLALIFGLAYSAILGGPLFPTDASAEAWTWLTLSSLIGFVFGDLCLLAAYVELGPRLSSLMMASTPIWTSLMGWLLFDEILSPRDLFAILLVVGGIAWAVSERPRGHARGGEVKQATTRGLLLGLGAALGQAGGLVASKGGLATGIAPFAAAQIRVLVGVIAFAILVTLTRWWGRIGRALRDREAMLPAAVGAVFGPFVGVIAALAAISMTTNTGVAATLMSLTPIMLIPIVWVRGERVGPAGVLGALIAVGGASVLFF
jgi:drug/metabolite transporter (DMT)-like permease